MDEEELFAKYWPDEGETPREETPDDPAPSLPPEVEPGDTIDEPSRGPDQPGTKVVLAREDIYNAEFLQWSFGSDVRYDHIERHWFIWHKGKHNWVEDKSEYIKVLAMNAAKKRIHVFVDEGDKDKIRIATALLGLQPLNRAVDALRFQRGIAVEDGHWDMNPELFCTANGVLNLRTGEFRPGEREDNITKASKVRYDSAAECPKWMQFLHEVFVTDELIDYVQTVVGYCMTGFTTEQVWFLLYGTGGNGKSVLVSTLMALFGDHFETAAADAFVSSRYGPSGSNNVAQLKNARLVVASEVSDRASFDGARIKALTGGEKVTARELYKNNSSWVPQLKLMMLVNHLPSTRDDTVGFWRRIKTIPFEVSFVGRENTHLVDELLLELPGILNWCLDGAVTWFQSGFAAEPSNAVTLRQEYQAESDPLAMFIHECVVETKVPSDTMAAREVYRIYADWSSGQGIKAMTETNFGRSSAMKALGSGKVTARMGAVYTGVKVYESGFHPVSGVGRASDDEDGD